MHVEHIYVSSNDLFVFETDEECYLYDSFDGFADLHKEDYWLTVNNSYFYNKPGVCKSKDIELYYFRETYRSLNIESFRLWKIRWNEKNGSLCFFVKAAKYTISYNEEDNYTSEPEGWYPGWQLMYETYAKWKCEPDERMTFLRKLMYKLLKNEFL